MFDETDEDFFLLEVGATFVVVEGDFVGLATLGLGDVWAVDSDGDGRPRTSAAVAHTIRLTTFGPRRQPQATPCATVS